MNALHVSMFYAHRATAEARDVDAEMRAVGLLIAQTWKAKSNGAPVSVKFTSGKQVWNECFATDSFNRATGSPKSPHELWDDWGKRVVDMVDSTTGNPRFNIFICPDEGIGAGSARILDHAIRLNRAVFFWDRPHGKLRRVDWIIPHDPSDFKTGWRLNIVGPEGRVL